MQFVRLFLVMFQHILQLQLCNFEKSYNYIAFALSTMSVLDFLVKQEKNLLEISMKGQLVCQSHSVDVRSMAIYSFIYDISTGRCDKHDIQANTKI